MGTQDVETGIIRTPSRRWFRGFLSTIFLQAFTLTFLAEWGDRSQIATIILAARAETEVSDKSKRCWQRVSDLEM